MSGGSGAHLRPRSDVGRADLQDRQEEKPAQLSSTRTTFASTECSAGAVRSRPSFRPVAAAARSHNATETRRQAEGLYRANGDSRRSAHPGAACRVPCPEQYYPADSCRGLSHSSVVAHHIAPRTQMALKQFGAAHPSFTGGSLLPTSAYQAQPGSAHNVCWLSRRIPPLLAAGTQTACEAADCCNSVAGGYLESAIRHDCDRLRPPFLPSVLPVPGYGCHVKVPERPEAAQHRAPASICQGRPRPSPSRQPPRHRRTMASALLPRGNVPGSPPGPRHAARAHRACASQVPGPCSGSFCRQRRPRIDISRIVSRRVLEAAGCTGGSELRS